MIEYFYDSYAIIEALKGNLAYRKYFDGPKGVTTRLNLMEVYYALLDNERYADEVYASFLSTVVEPTDDQVKAAMRERRKMHKKGLRTSYVDAIGYVLAREKGLRFLTGDREFRELPGVEFVK